MAIGPVRGVVLALGACAVVGGCGGGTDATTTARTPSTPTRATAAANAPVTPAVASHHGPIPPALRTAESAAEDTIDLALAGRRGRVVAKAHALLSGRDYISPHDIKTIAHDVLRHRILVSYEAEAQGKTTDHVVAQILENIPVP